MSRFKVRYRPVNIWLRWYFRKPRYVLLRDHSGLRIARIYKQFFQWVD